MLGGEYRHVVDSKNRLFIPATHRKELGENIAIVRNTHGKYLSVYSEADWEAYCAKIKEKLPTGSNMRGTAEYRSHLAEVMTVRALRILGGDRNAGKGNEPNIPDEPKGVPGAATGSQ